MDGFDPKLVTYSLMAATLVKVVVDLVKMAAEMPQWIAPALALLLGVAFVLVLMIASEVPLTAPAIAQGIIAGVLAASTAIGSTALQARTKPSTDARASLSVPVRGEG